MSLQTAIQPLTVNCSSQKGNIKIYKLTQWNRKLVLDLFVLIVVFNFVSFREEKPIQARTVNLVGQKKPPQQNDVR